MPSRESEPQQHPDGGRRGDPQRQGGASEAGHLRPEIDAKEGKGDGERQIAQDRQQSSGQGSGQS